MNQTDFEYICWLCSPDYMIPRAKKYGLELVRDAYPEYLDLLLEDSNFLAVMGAFQAGKDSRNSIRSYLRYIRHRDNIKIVDIGLASKMRKAGWLGSFQRVDLLTDLTEWRDDTKAIWPNGNGIITSKLTIPIEQPGYKVDVAVVKALSEMLVRYPRLNRAFLQGRAWQRYDGHLMINLEPKREQVRTALIDASNLSFEQTSAKLTKSVRNLIKAEKEYRKEAKVLDTLFKRWCKTGFIASPAGAMVSLVGTKFLPATGAEGQAALLTNVNGIGIGVISTYSSPNECVLWAGFDHRLYDADHESKYLIHMQERVPALLRGEE